MSESEYWDKIWTEHSAVRVNNFARRAWPRIQAKNLRTLLDLGCGAGQDSCYFARRGLQVSALDIAGASLERLHQSDSRIIYLNQDLCHLKIAEHSFDVIYAHLSLQYFDHAQTRQIFLDIQRTLRTGGLFFVKCKSTSDRLYGEGETAGSDMFFCQHLRHFFSKEYMAEMLEPFSILSIRKTSSVYGRYPSSFIEAVATTK